MVLRLWKFKFLHFRDAGRTKYALETFHFQADQLALLSPHESRRQLWNRGFNLHGGIGKNIPLDLMVEHNNHYVKEMISNHGANVTFASAQLVSRAAKGISDVLRNLDSSLKIKIESGQHTSVDKQKDVFTVVEEVMDKQMSVHCPGRSYRAFPKMERDVLHHLQPSDLLTWIRRQKRIIHDQELKHAESL